MSPKATPVDYEQLVTEEELILEATEAVVKLLKSTATTRQELAARLGKTKGFVSHLLSGERNMTLRSLADMGYVLGFRFRVVAEPLLSGSYAQRREARAPLAGPDRLGTLEGGERSPARERSDERWASRKDQSVNVADWKRSLEDRAEQGRSAFGPDSHEWTLVG
jgi:hypothetical protein